MRRTLDFKRKQKVIVVDDKYEHASGVRELVNLENDYEVIANAGNANVAISLIKKYQPDIVLMDVNMPEMDGINAIAEIQKLNLKTRIIVLTAYDDADLIYRAMKVGACGYVLKTMVSAQLIKALDEVSMGKIYLPNILCSKFFEYFQEFERNGQKAVEEEVVPQQEETETEENDNFEISDIYVEEENPDGIIDKLFHTVAEENNQPQEEEKENEHKVDPDEFALYKKYLG